ncbi:MAG: hypothetical protein Kow0056_06520 [Coriobacteriia bacterium]
MPNKAPRAKRIVTGEQRVVYSLIIIVVILIGVVLALLFGGGMLSDEPRTPLERDYVLLLQGLERYPDDPAVLMTLAEVELELGKEADALEHASLAYEYGFETPGIPLRYAQILVQVGDTEQAKQAIDQEIELDTVGNNPEPLFLLAQILREEGDLEGALENMETGLDLAYQAADMRILYADMLAEAGREDDAIAQYEEALRYLPGDERAIAGLAALGVEYEATQTVDPHAEDGEQ